MIFISRGVCVAEAEQQTRKNLQVFKKKKPWEPFRDSRKLLIDGCCSLRRGINRDESLRKERERELPISACLVSYWLDE